MPGYSQVQVKLPSADRSWPSAPTRCPGWMAISAASDTRLLLPPGHRHHRSAAAPHPVQHAGRVTHRESGCRRNSPRGTGLGLRELERKCVFSRKKQRFSLQPIRATSRLICPLTWDKFGILTSKTLAQGEKWVLPTVVPSRFLGQQTPKRRNRRHQSQ